MFPPGGCAVVIALFRPRAWRQAAWEGPRDAVASLDDNPVSCTISPTSVPISREKHPPHVTDGKLRLGGYRGLVRVPRTAGDRVSSCHPTPQTPLCTSVTSLPVSVRHCPAEQLGPGLRTFPTEFGSETQMQRDCTDCIVPWWSRLLPGCSGKLHGGQVGCGEEAAGKQGQVGNGVGEGRVGEGRGQRCSLESWVRSVNPGAVLRPP